MVVGKGNQPYVRTRTYGVLSTVLLYWIYCCTGYRPVQLAYSPLFTYGPSDPSSFYALYIPPYRQHNSHDCGPMALPRPAFEPKHDNDPNAFGMSYAAMAGLDIQPHYDGPWMDIMFLRILYSYAVLLVSPHYILNML